MLIFLAHNYSIKALCARQFLNKSGDSIYALLKSQIYRFNLQDSFNIQATRITHKVTGSELFFLGLWRNIDEIKSLEGVDICLLEEAHNLSEEQWDILNGTFRKPGFQFWIIFNPKLSVDFVYKRFIVNPPPSTIVRKINYLENPWLDVEYITNVIEAMKSADYDEYCHQFLGEPKTDDDDSIIKRAWIIAAIDAHKKLGIVPTGRKKIGFDVGDSGEDLCATVSVQGVLTLDCDTWKGREDEILKSCTRVYRMAFEEQQQIIYDAIGVGASCGAKFNELGYKFHRKFFAGGAVVDPDKKTNGIKNKDFYSNIKAQAWWSIAERLKNTYNAVNNGHKFEESEMIFISSECRNLEQLIEELSTPRKSFDNAGKVKVESKDDLKKRDIKSPNCADAFIMSHVNLKISDWDLYN